MMKKLLIALQFLTIFPIGIFIKDKESETSEEDLGRSMVYFPFAGLLISFLLVVSSFILNPLPRLVSGVIILIISIIISGGIHLDGLADTCDGFYGNGSKEKVLEIMRDSRVGVMGVIGIVFILLLKFSLLVSIPQSLLWKALIMMIVFGRWAQNLACYASCYARSKGKAKCFIEYADRGEFFKATLFTLVLFLLIMGLKGLILFAISVVPVLMFIKYTKKKIGGMTGDTIGAVNEIAEAGMLLFILCW